MPELRKELEDLAATWPLAEGTAFETVDAGGCPCEWITASPIGGDVLHIPSGETPSLNKGDRKCAAFRTLKSDYNDNMRRLLAGWSAGCRLRVFSCPRWRVLPGLLARGGTTLLLRLRIRRPQVSLSELPDGAGAPFPRCAPSMFPSLVSDSAISFVQPRWQM